MLVRDHLDDLLGIERIGAVQRDENVFRCVESLQAIHPVAHRRKVRALGEVEVPARPRALSPRHQRSVGMDRRLVSLVAHRAEHLPLGLGRVGDHRERLVRMRGNHDFVEELGIAPVGFDRNTAARQALDAAHARAQAKRVAQLASDRVHIRTRAADDRPPLRPSPQLELAVVLQELGEERDREVPHGGRIGRPHGRDLGHDDPLHEPVRVAHIAHELADRRASAAADRLPGVAVEANLIAKHAEESRAQKVPRLSEEPASRTREFERTVRRRNRKSHRCRSCFNAQVTQEILEVWVIPLVEDDETGVNPVLSARAVGYADRVRVSARTVIALVHDQVVISSEEVSGCEACNASANDSDSHAILIRDVSACAGFHVGTLDGCSSIRT